MEDSYSSDNGSKGGRIIRGHWRPEEDDKLRQLVLTYGAKNWNSIAESIEGRTGKSCRLRWFNQLNPMIKKGPFTKEEEDRLIEAHKIHGNKWSTIANLFPGRTDNALKNHFHVVTARKRREEMKTPGVLGASCYSDARFQNSLMSRNRFGGYGSPCPFQYQTAALSSSIGFYGMRIGAETSTENENCVLNKPRRFLTGTSSWMATSFTSRAPAPYKPTGIIDQRIRQLTPSMEGKWSLFINGDSKNVIYEEGSSSVDKDAPPFIDFLGVGDKY